VSFLSTYADDIVIFVKSQEEVSALTSIVEDFGALSVAKVNWAKSEALAVGNW